MLPSRPSTNPSGFVDGFLCGKNDFFSANLTHMSSDWIEGGGLHPHTPCQSGEHILLLSCFSSEDPCPSARP